MLTARLVAAQSPDVMPSPAPAADPRLVRWTLALESSTKNLTIGAEVPHFGFGQARIGSDFMLTPLLTGLALDDLDGLRITLSETVGARVHFGPFRLSRRDAVRTSTPGLVVGLGFWSLAEFDSLAQSARVGHSGIYTGVSTGPFVGLEFSDVKLQLSYRPFGRTAYFSEGKWDATPFDLGTPTLDVDLVYTFPMRRPR